MPIYKNKKRKSYTVRVNYIDETGKHRAIYGTASSYSGALEKYQELFASRYNTCHLTLKELAELYFTEYKIRNKISSSVSMQALINRVMTTINGNIRVDKITPLYVRAWQSKLINMGFSQTYLYKLNATLSSIIQHAIIYYNLQENPVKKAGNIGKRFAEEKPFWTFAEFQRFINGINREKEISCWVLFNILFYTGARIGEVRALYPKDIDLENRVMHITKTYALLHGVEYLGTTKTKKSTRDIKIPPFLCDIIREYIKKLPSLNIRLFFNISDSHINEVKKEVCKKVGLTYITNHDFRHSAISFLISENVPILAVSKQVGHSTPAITYKVYAHLYTDRDKRISEAIDSDLADFM